MSIYWLIVAIVIGFGMIMPQEWNSRKQYVVLMAGVHIFFCAFRYQFLTGDLIKYNTEFRHLQEVGYFSDQALHQWKNTGFYWLMKLIGDLTGGNYQAFLIVLAVLTGVITAVFIYRYSTKPWVSYLVWNCMNFYLLYDYLAIKQGLAMAVLMLAMMGIFEKKPTVFLAFTLLAGFIHMPALAFLPAYVVANRKVNGKLIFAYLVSAGVIFMFRVQIVDSVSDLYYEEAYFTLIKRGLGGKVYVIVLILLTGLVLKGFKEVRFNQLFNILVSAAILQMFSGFDNVYTRLADYYLQFAVLFIPAIFYEDKTSKRNDDALPALFWFNERSISLMVAVLAVILIWWYHTTCLGVPVGNDIDNYLNYRFMWQ